MQLCFYAMAKCLSIPYGLLIPFVFDQVRISHVNGNQQSEQGQCFKKHVDLIAQVEILYL